jgi:cAMP-dependent protein kinase regulator
LSAQNGSPEIRSERFSKEILDRRVYRAGHVFFREGDPGDHAYLIQAGAISIRKNDTELLTVGPGRLFGELALLRNVRRAATAVAAGPASCELIRKTAFDAAIATMPSILRALTRSYLERLAPSR